MPLVMNDESETLVRVVATDDEAGRRAYRIVLVFPDGTSRQSLPLASLTVATTVAGILNELGIGSKTSPSGSASVPMFDLLSLLVPGDAAGEQLQELMTAATTASAENPQATPAEWVDAAACELEDAHDDDEIAVLEECLGTYRDAFDAAARECAEAARAQARTQAAQL